MGGMAGAGGGVSGVERAARRRDEVAGLQRPMVCSRLASELNEPESRSPKLRGMAARGVHRDSE